VETALLLPVLLVLLAGGYWSFRHFAYAGAAESGAQALLLRRGRGQAPIDADLARTITPDVSAVRFRGTDTEVFGPVPLFRGMTGTTVGTVELHRDRELAGAFLTLPAHSMRREAEAAVDCWGEGTRSGSTIRCAVTTVVLTGWLQ